MSYEGWLCIGGYELANVVRTVAYDPCLFQDCGCPALDDVYISPQDDPAPWYEASHPESADFFGLFPDSVEPSVAASRDVEDSLAIGSVVGAEKLPGRVIEVVGRLIARDRHSMYWGKAWLTEAARGQLCHGDCRGDELSVLPFCRSDGDESDFRTLVGTALVDGPRFSPVSADAEYVIESVQMQFVSRMPYLYAPAVVQVSDEVVAGGASSCALITTDEWFQGEALRIQIAASELAAATDLTLTVTVSLDGACPETRVPASITYAIPELVRSGGLTIDAARREVGFANPTSKRTEPGFRYIDFDGPFCWPVLPPCVSVCVCLDNGGASEVTWRVESRKREL